MLVCDKCEGKIIEGSQFCPHCGDPVTSADLPDKTIAESNVAQVELSFGYSSSKNYEHAVSIARNIPSYKEEGSDKNITHSIVVPISEVELLINIYDLVGSWKSSRMLINGKPETKSALVYYGVGCYRERQKSYKPEQYCFGQRDFEINIWGCKRLDMPIWSWGGGWLANGQFDKNGIWHFDKKRIKHELEIKVHENELCPVLDPKNIYETLERLPDTIDPKTNPNWDYTTTFEEVNGEYREVANGIKPILKKANSYVIGSYIPEWENAEDQSDESNTETININISLDEISNDNKTTPQSTTKKSGCMGMVLLFVVTTAILIIFAT